MKSYLPYIVGALAGVLIALLFSNLLDLTGTPQLALFAGLPVLGGALSERFVQRSARKS
ncbi:UNVERIFIED_ORG: hypothetical protein LHK14_16195 [Roseateles sp. XES5]|nr:hypothetical protein [Roseateles sp. XES5]